MYERIYAVVRQIPYGRVASYGQVGKLVGCTARQVGYALHASLGEDVPWQRVINSQGKISPHGDGIGTAMQHTLLVAEGVKFDPNGRIDMERFGWLGPVR
jgi:methylated-DNA-protein-cysteine methyltransferase-like protein